MDYINLFKQFFWIFLLIKISSKNDNLAPESLIIYSETFQSAYLKKIYPSCLYCKGRYFDTLNMSCSSKCAHVALHLVTWGFKVARADPRNKIGSLGD